MIDGFNPFKKREIQETEHGIINYQHNMGTCYITNRNKNHIFKKYQAFAISKSELEIAYNKRVRWVMIIYHKENGTSTPYRLEMEKAILLNEYNNKGDQQKLFPIKTMQQRKEKEWE